MPPQIEMVERFRQAQVANETLVSQMLMGGGKTKVVCPLLGLFLATGSSLPYRNAIGRDVAGASAVASAMGRLVLQVGRLVCVAMRCARV